MTPQAIDIILQEIRRRRRGAVRIFHGRGGCFAGLEFLNIDLYAPLVLIMLYRPVEEAWLRELCRAIASQTKLRAESFLVQHRHLHGCPQQLLSGEMPRELQLEEDGLLYRIRPSDAQNPGFFPDMARGRELVRGISRGKAVLNLFAYSCSFSCAALAGGADRVINLDMSRSALELGRQNHRLNGLEGRGAGFLCHDLFKSFGKLEKLGPFDLVILDPPAAQGRSFLAERDWPKLAQRLPRLLRAGGEFLACVSAPHLGRSFLEQTFTGHLPSAGLLAGQRAGEDFPESDPDKGLHLLHYRWPGPGPETSLESETC